MLRNGLLPPIYHYLRFPHLYILESDEFCSTYWFEIATN